MINHIRTLLFLFIVLPGALFSQPVVDTNFDVRYSELLNNRTMPDSVRLHKLFDVNWDVLMYRYPDWATSLGYNQFNDRWSDESLEAIERYRKDTRTDQVLALVKRENLSEADKLNYDLFKYGVEEQRRGEQFPGELLPITQLNGVQLNAAYSIDVMPTKTVTDYENILKRLEGLPTLLDQTRARMEKGRLQGITPAQFALRSVPDQIAKVASDDPMESPLLMHFKNFPKEIPSSEQTRLKSRAVAIYKVKLQPAFNQFKKYVEETYLPNARKTFGYNALPNGKEWYRFNARSSMTVDLDPDTVFNIGMREVKRIRFSMDSLIKAIGFKGSFQDFKKFLRNDKRFYFKTKDELLGAYRNIAKRIDPQLIKLFGTLPRTPYGVEPVPEYSEKAQPTAYYNSGSIAAGRAGTFFANTYALNTRPKWEMEALTLHEAVPGHHLQISIGQELENVPKFRTEGGYTAFIEGWGFYAESLGDELGMYKDPYSKFGQFTYEMWRAIRLVVDVGIHYKGWSRDEAIKFFEDNSPKNRHDIEVEVDRYIVWPGQALAYKIGELKIKELKTYAKRELGDQFDIRVFHDKVLDNGALPLEVLEKHIKDWVTETKEHAK